MSLQKEMVVCVFFNKMKDTHVSFEYFVFVCLKDLLIFYIFDFIYKHNYIPDSCCTWGLYYS